jgi:alkylated DNA repair dioxygenase AlkB
MSVALGDDCEFTIGKKTGRPRSKMVERNGKEKTILMKSGDAIFFDGGSVPHQVTRCIPNTAPKWWEDHKVPNGSRCVVLFREKEVDFYKNMIKNAKKLSTKSTESSES